MALLDKNVGCVLGGIIYVASEDHSKLCCLGWSLVAELHKRTLQLTHECKEVTMTLVRVVSE